MAIEVMVVDNNPVLLRAVSHILEQEVCNVCTAETGLEALEILEEYNPEIVFTDLVMPLVSGEQLCRILRNTKRHNNVFIVVLSAIVLADHERILQEIPCDLCIAKGNISEIREQVQDALSRYKTGRDNSSHVVSALDARLSEGLQSVEVTTELLSAQKHLVSILANLDEGILELSEQGKIVRMNESALNILDAREELLTGKLLYDAVEFNEHKTNIQQWVHEQLIAGGGGTFDILEQEPLVTGNSIITASFTVVQEKGNCFGLCIFRDISRQFKAEENTRKIDEAFRFARKMDALSCMAGGVAHDFNNLLTIICGNLDMFLHSGHTRSEEDARKLVEQTRKAVLVAVDLTRQISCFSNFGIISRETVRIEELVEKSVREFFYKNLQNFSFSARCQDCIVSADPRELTQAIENVLQNSIEALSSADPIEIIVEKESLEVPELRSGQYLSAGSYVKIDIRDKAEGIDQAEMYRIFDPYYSTKERGAVKGLGLGLAVVYSIIRNHGGYVIVDSEKGAGTTVSFHLPLQEETTVDQVIESKKRKGTVGVLLVDSDEQMREIGKIMLSHLGYDAMAVASAEQMLQVLHEQESKGSYDISVVILDVSGSNKEKMSELCRNLRSRFQGLKLIAMSGTTLEPVMEDCQGCGFVNGLPKPYTLDTLGHIVASAVGKDSGTE